MTDAIIEKASAKVNFDLFVTGKRFDGYHFLDSMVVFTEFGDEISVQAAKDLSLLITGPYKQSIPADDSNLVLKAAKALQKATRTSFGAEITLQKNIPTAAGVGGGSADAAAALKALMTLWGVSMEADELLRLGLSLGADIPVCLGSVPAYMRGIGEDIQKITHMPAFGLLLVNPGISLSTPSVFKNRAAEFSPIPDRSIFNKTTNTEDLVHSIKRQRNDLSDSAEHLAPVVRQILSDIMLLEGCLLSRMSGSGATCFGLFTSELVAQQAEKALFLRNSGWWMQATKIKI